MSKKVSRAKRKDLRAKGQLVSIVRAVEERRATERRAVEEDSAERAHAAREEIAEESDAPRVAEKKKAGPNRTLLVMVGLIAAAGIIFWLTQRSPTKETKIDAVPKLEAPIVGEPVKPSLPAPTAIAAAPVMTAAPAITVVAPAPAVTAAPAITVAPVVTAAPAPAKAHDPPAPAPAPRPDKPKAPPKPAAGSSDPYG